MKPEVVTKSIEEFSKPQYAVDILKVGVPVSMPHVEGAPGAERDWLYSRAEAKNIFVKQRTPRASRLSIFLKALATNSLTTHCNWRRKRRPISPVFCADGPRGKMAFPST